MLTTAQADAYLNVIMLGAFAAGFVPDIWAQVATTVVQVAVGTAKELQARHRSNTFLDQMNNQLFMPRGLFAMVMTFKPDSGKAIEGQQLDFNEAIAKYSSHDAGRVKETMKGLRISSGTSYGEFQIPHAAPLIYPSLDDAMLDQSGQKQNALKGTGAFIADYMDRRAQAKYVGHTQLSGHLHWSNRIYRIVGIQTQRYPRSHRGSHLDLAIRTTQSTAARS
jgi:hypothetical protein